MYFFSQLPYWRQPHNNTSLYKQSKAAKTNCFTRKECQWQARSWFPNKVFENTVYSCPALKHSQASTKCNLMRQTPHFIILKCDILTFKKCTSLSTCTLFYFQMRFNQYLYVVNLSSTCLAGMVKAAGWQIMAARARHVCSSEGIDSNNAI